MIKRILKYGAVAVASFELGTIAQTHYLNHKAKGDTPKDDLWKGESCELILPIEAAERSANKIRDTISSGEYYNAVFTKEDLKDVERKLSHRISDANEKGYNVVTIEISDRERLRFIDHVVFPSHRTMCRPDEY